MKLNLGCGTDIREGWVNLDFVHAPGVDVVHDLNVTPLPFDDGVFDHILADNVLEHLLHYEPVVEDCYRVLRPGGTMEIRVPYGITGLRSAYHLRLFDMKTLRCFCLSEKDRAVARGYQLSPRFDMVRIKAIRHLPFKWHLDQYFGIKTDLGVGRRYEIHALLRKPFVKSGEVRQ
jgi:SAM-dependent methyltransferase